MGKPQYSGSSSTNPTRHSQNEPLGLPIVLQTWRKRTAAVPQEQEIDPDPYLPISSTEKLVHVSESKSNNGVYPHLKLSLPLGKEAGTLLLGEEQDSILRPPKSMGRGKTLGHKGTYWLKICEEVLGENIPKLIRTKYSKTNQNKRPHPTTLPTSKLTNFQ